MKIIRPIAKLSDKCPPFPTTLYLIFIMFLIVTECDQNVQHGSKQENHHDSDKTINLKDTKLSRAYKKNSKVKDDQRHSDHLSDGVNKEVDDAALDRFLGNVFKAKNELKWIDEAVRDTCRGKSGKKSRSGIQDRNKYSEVSRLEGTPSRSEVGYHNKLRDKRSFDQNYKTMWMLYRNGYVDDLRPSEGPYFEDKSQFNDYNHRWNDDEIHPSNDKFDGPIYQEARDDEPVDDWSEVEDLPFPGDWLTSDRNLESGNNQKDRLLNDYVNPRENVGAESDARSNSRDERGAANVKPTAKEVKSEQPLTLESLKEAVLEMKKSLTDDGKKLHGDSKKRTNNFGNKNKEDDSDQGQDEDDRINEKNENEEHDGNLENNNDKTLELETQRTKRTRNDKIDNEIGPKLFYRAGFGELYPKNNYNRQRRKTDDISDHPAEITIDQFSDNDSQDCENSSVINVQNKNYDEAKGALSYGVGIRKISTDDTSDKINMKESEDSKISDLLKKVADMAGKEPTESPSMGVEEKVKNLEGNSLQTFGSARNELRTDSGETTNRDAREESRETGMLGGTKEKGGKTEEVEKVENLSSNQGEQVIKVFEPREHLYQTSGSTKEVERIEPDEKKPGKLSRQISVANNTKEEPGNIKVLLESENKNLIKISDTDNDRHHPSESSQKSKSMVLDELGVKKNLVLQANGNPCKSVSSVVDIKIHKAHLDIPGPSNNDKSMCDNNMLNCKDNTKIKDGYIRRKLLQKNRIGTKEVEDEEYSEEEVEDVASNWREEDAEEDEGDDNEEDDELSELKRAADSGGCQKPKSMKAKVDVMIHDKLSSKGKGNVDYTRQRRKPMNIIEYYDYDSEAEQREHEEELINDGERRITNNHGQNSIESETRLATSANENKPCNEDVGKKVNLHEIAMKKMQKQNQKTKNKGPKEEIIDPVKTADKSSKGKGNSRSVSEDEFKDEEDRKIQGEDGSSRINRGSNQDESLKPLQEEKESNDREKSSRASEKEIGESMEYLENLRKQLDLETIENLFQDVQSMDILGSDQGKGSKNVYSDANDERLSSNENSRKPNAVKELYDELKNVYDWSDNEVEDKPRFKGNQRLHYENDDKEGIQNSAVESSDFHNNDFQDLSSKTDDKINNENPENKNKYYATNDGEVLNTFQAKPSMDTNEINPENLASNFFAAPTSMSKNNSKCLNKTNNKAKNNYSDLKSTDDLFKGGAEQNNTSEDAAQSMPEIKSEVVLEKDGPKPASEQQKQYTINTETRSPYEKFEVPREENEHGGQEKQVALTSEDLHESFVESSDWMDDFDDDNRLRLGRALKTIEETPSISTINKNEVTPSGTNKCENVTHASFSPQLFQPASTMFSISKINEVNDGVDIKTSSNENKNKIRTKRELMSSYQTFYDDLNQNRRDQERMDYSPYSGSQKILDDNLRNPNFYENFEHVDRKSLASRWRNEPRDNYDEEEIGDNDDYSKVIRSTNSKKKTRHARKNHLGRPFKKYRKKGRIGKSKYSESSNPRNRRQHKHLSSLKKRKHRDNRKHDKKRKSKSSILHGHSKRKKNSEISNDKNKKGTKIHHKKRGFQGATSGGRVHHENVEDQSTMKSNGETRKKEITALLAADNIEDDSQMDSALHGELAGKIVQQIFEQVQENNDLKTSLGPGLYRKQKFEDIMNAEENYRQTRNGEETKHTEESMKKVIQLLNHLVSEEVQSQTCAPLPPDLREFLDWMLEGDGQNNILQEGPPIPFLLEGPEQQKYLFEGSSNGRIDINELQKKLQIMQDLIKEYNSLSEKEKAKVQDVHDYLLKQLDLFLKYIIANEERTRRKREGKILEYRGAINNDANGSNFPGKNAFSSLINMPALLKASNPTFDHPGERFRDDVDLRERKRAPRSLKTNSKRQKKPRRVKHRKHRRKPKNSKHKASGSRRKRAFLSQDLWDPFDSGFEKPLTYSSLSKVDGTSKESAFTDELQKLVENQDKEKNEYWEDVFARHIGSNQEHSIVNLDPARHPLITGNMKTHILAEHEDIPTDYAENKAEINEYRNFPGGRRIRESRAKNVDNKFLLDEDAESNEDNFDDINNNLSNLDYDDEPTSNSIRKREIPRSIKNPESFNNVSNVEKILDINKNIPSNSPSRSELVTDLKKKNNDKQTNEQTSSLSLITNEQDDLPIKGKDRLEDEVILLNKRAAWKRKNEEQLEEVAFGKDMRNKLLEKEIFEKLTEMDKRKNAQEKNVEGERNVAKLSKEDSGNNKNCELLNEDKLKTLEEKINVYSDNNHDNLLPRETRKTEGEVINLYERKDAKVRENEKDKQAAINIEGELKDISRSPLEESSNFLSGIEEEKGQHEALQGDNWKMEKEPDLVSQLKNLKAIQC